MAGSKGIVAAVLVIILLGTGYFIYNERNSSDTSSAVDLLATYKPVAPPTSEGSGSAKPGEEISITLSAQNNSGQDGIAILKDLAGKTQVTVKLTGAPATAEPAHIHIGSCPTPGAVKYPLTNLVNGVSETTLDVSIPELKAMRPIAVNVHKSAEDLKTYISCGDI